MSDAARVNEPFPGPLVAEYYIDNRNYLPSTRDGWQDVSFEILVKKKKEARGFISCTAITMRYTILHLAILCILITFSYYQCNTSSILHRIRGFILHLHFFLNLNSSISENRSSYKLLSRSYPLMFSMESFMQRNMELFLRYDKENKICTETIRAYRKF